MGFLFKPTSGEKTTPGRNHQKSRGRKRDEKVEPIVQYPLKWWNSSGWWIITITMVVKNLVWWWLFWIFRHPHWHGNVGMETVWCSTYTSDVRMSCTGNHYNQVVGPYSNASSTHHRMMLCAEGMDFPPDSCSKDNFKSMVWWQKSKEVEKVAETQCVYHVPQRQWTWLHEDCRRSKMIQMFA